MKRSIYIVFYSLLSMLDVAVDPAHAAPVIPPTDGPCVLRVIINERINKKGKLIFKLKALELRKAAPTFLVKHFNPELPSDYILEVETKNGGVSSYPLFSAREVIIDGISPQLAPGVLTLNQADMASYINCVGDIAKLRVRHELGVTNLKKVPVTKFK